MSGPGVVRFISWIQLVLSIVFAIATISVYWTYRSSLGDMSRAIADSILSIADGVGRVAAAIDVRQELIDDATDVLIASRKVVAETRSSAAAQGQQMSQYADRLRDAAALSVDVSNTLGGIGDQMSFAVPTKVRMEGMKPVLEWSKPLQVQAAKLKAHGETFRKLGVNLTATAGAINTDVGKMNAAFIDASEKTLKMIDDTIKATKKLKSQDMPQAIAALKATSDNFRQASVKANTLEQLAASLLAAALVLSALFAFNSVGALLLVKSLTNGQQRPFG